MPDIQMRFHYDMLVLSSPLDASLHKQGIDEDTYIDLLCVDEPETVLEALRVQSSLGIPCIVTPTKNITRARLAHERLADKSSEIARAAVSVVKRLTPQHILAEIGPTGLPLDAESKTSMVANRDQYTSAALAFAETDIDALFLNGFETCDDLLCALMGVRKAWDGPVFATVSVDASGNVSGKPLEEAIELMDEYEADVAGFQTSAIADGAAQLVTRCCKVTDLPVLVQLQVLDDDADVATNPHADADSLVATALRLRDAGAQFLQATGAATASHAGALAAVTTGLDAIR